MLTDVNVFIFCLLQIVHADGRNLYLNEFAVEFHGSWDDMNRMANKHGHINNGRVLKNYYAIVCPSIRKRSFRKAKHHYHVLMREPQVKWVQQQVALTRVLKNINSEKQTAGIGLEVLPNDPLWEKTWYLNNNLQGKDLNVEEAWSKNYTGEGIVVAVVDDGLEKNHPDLSKNFDPRASYAIRDNDTDPTPKYVSGNSGDNHGTKCAGAIGAQFNNGICGVGVAYNSKLGDIMEAIALSYERQYIDVYSNSWGPSDDGDHFEAPKIIMQSALKEGVELGRKGRGSIFVWASGNGGKQTDNCNCDGYNSNIYTITVKAATDKQEIPWYAEQCSSSMVTTYSSGGDKLMMSTDIHNECTERFEATSAAAPIAAGICALTLQANPKLTWRDMQHIIVRTAKPRNLNDPNWSMNKAGKNFSNWFGFGLMDAGHMVRLATSWKTVPLLKQCSVSFLSNSEIIDTSNMKFSENVQQICSSEISTNVLYLESVQVAISISQTGSTSRSDVEIFLISPQGTKSTLLSKRPRDTKSKGIKWLFTTVHFWGESTVGEWTLEIHNGSPGIIKLEKWELIIYGTTTVVGDNGGPDVGPKPDQQPPHCCSWSHGDICSGCTRGRLLHLNSCVEICPEKFYTSTDGKEKHCSTASCRMCTPYCMTCTGPAAYQCTKCQKGYEIVNSRCTKVKAI